MTAVAREQPSAFGAYELHETVVSDLVSSTCRATPMPHGAGARREDVALRLVDQRLIGQRRAVEGFLHVNRRIAAVDHPHLLRVVDAGTDSGVAYSASVWRDGMPLSQVLLESAPLGVRDVLRLGGQLAEALDTVHGHGIVHGTFGLPTVWIKRRANSRVPPSAAVTGFGSSHLLAPILDDLEDAEAAVDLLFVAPEQLRGEPAEPPADQYALACVLFTALTGTTPFRGETNNDLFGAHLFDEPPRASVVRDDLDPGWDEVFARALSKDPTGRYDNCRTLLLAAGRCAPVGGAQRAAARPPASVQTANGVATDAAPAADTKAQGSGRRALRLVLVVALLLALLFLGLQLGMNIAGPSAAGTIAVGGALRSADGRDPVTATASARSPRRSRDRRRRSP